MALSQVSPDEKEAARVILALTSIEDEEEAVVECCRHGLPVPSRDLRPPTNSKVTGKPTPIKYARKDMNPHEAAVSVGIFINHTLPGAHRIPGTNDHNYQDQDGSEVDRCSIADPSPPPLVWETTLVVDDDDDEDQAQRPARVNLEEAKAVAMPSPLHPKKGTRLVALVLLSLALLGFAIWMTFVFHEPDVSAMGAPLNSNHSFDLPFDMDLHPHTITNILEDPESPQHKANVWMLQDPFLNTYPLWRQHQRFVMAVLYYSLEGDHWFRNDHWLSYQVPECEWFSQSPQPCNEHGELSTEDLQSNNLGGTLPMELELSTVTTLNYAHNHIAGSLPLVVDTNHVEVLIFSNNSLTSVGNAVAMAGFSGTRRRVLKIDHNQIRFTSMDFMAAFPNLEVLNVTGNQLAGTLPTNELYSTPHLTYLGLGHNRLQGTVPTELGLLSSLSQLDLSSNDGIGGSLPEELTGMEALTMLDVSGTSLTGSIPLELCSAQDEKAVTVTVSCTQLQCC